MKFYKSLIMALRQARKQNKRVRWVDKAIEQKGKVKHTESFKGLVSEGYKTYLVKRRFYYLVD